jgi:hypothetical protein
VRHQTRKTYDLLNAIVAKFGDRITWTYRHRDDAIERNGKLDIYFQFHGNKYANWIEFSSGDIVALRNIRQAFPEEFKGDVQEKEGVI